MFLAEYTVCNSVKNVPSWNQNKIQTFTMFSPYEKMKTVPPPDVIPTRPEKSFSYNTVARQVSAHQKTWSEILKSIRKPQGFFVCTEKVHGANFCFMVSWENEVPSIHVARRNALLTSKDPFFKGWLRVFEVYKERCIHVAEHVRKVHLPELQHVLIYGELFGGLYPGKESTYEVTPIQTELLYRPDLEFYAFDVCGVFENGEKTYLQYADCAHLFESYGFEFWAKPLFIGGLHQALQFPVESFQTTVGVGKNEMEGIVVRNLHERILFKIKSSRFLETVSCGTQINHLTVARLDAVLSKMGKVQNADLVITQLLEDIVCDDPKVNTTALYSKAKDFVNRHKTRWSLKQ